MFRKNLPYIPPLRAIRAFCLECKDHNGKEVMNCSKSDCSLHDYRLGHNPNSSRGRSTSKHPDLFQRKHSHYLQKKKGKQIALDICEDNPEIPAAENGINQEL